MTRLKLGIIVNPFAGLGGSLGLKGSDDLDLVREHAGKDGLPAHAPERMARALAPLQEHSEALDFFAFEGSMGAHMLRELGFNPQILGAPESDQTTEADTARAAQAMQAAGVDLLVFAGGDGTARNIADAVGLSVPCLGVPAGVKIHSGVYTTSPEAAGRVLKRLVNGLWAPLIEREVRDIDEQAFARGVVRARHYSELLVPEVPEALQQVKNAGAEVDELAQLDLADGVIEQLDPGTLYVVGPGSTTYVILQQLGLEGTLLGVDLLLGNQLRQKDLNAAQIREALAAHTGPVSILVTAIGGQGHIFGRGNQQIAADIIEQVGRDSIWLVATPEKLKALEGRPLLVDTNNPSLDCHLSGALPVTTGYRQQVIYPVGETQ